MNFLKKVGKGLKDFFTPSKGAPLGNGGRLISALFPQVGGAITAIAAIVVQTEALFASAFGADSKKGMEKGRAALPFVEQIIINSELLAGREIIDQNRFITGCQKLMDGVVDILQAIKQKEIEVGRDEENAVQKAFGYPATPGELAGRTYSIYS
jgi:hypothetical protein